MRKQSYIFRKKVVSYAVVFGELVLPPPARTYNENTLKTTEWEAGKKLGSITDRCN